jgi:hypothetical protein
MKNFCEKGRINREEIGKRKKKGRGILEEKFLED